MRCFASTLASKLSIIGAILIVSHSVFTQDSVKNYPEVPPSIYNFQIEGMDGTPFTLADYKGRVLLVNTWATWCGPCRSQIPLLVELNERFHPLGLQMIGLNVGDGDGNAEKVEEIGRYVSRFRINYNIGVSNGVLTSEIQKLAKFQGVPLSIVIDADGRLRGVFLGSGNGPNKQMKFLIEELLTAK